MANEKRLIDANALLEDAELYPTIRMCLADIVDIERLVKDQPTVDAVEVIRCKDCKRCNHDTQFGGYWCNGRRVKADDFCSFGERRTEDG